MSKNMTSRDQALRNMVREVLQDALSNRGHAIAQNPRLPEPVRIETDADLQAFLKRVTEPLTIEAIRAGRLKFVLTKAGGAEPNDRHLNGVITEQKIDGLAASGTLVLGPGAILTPLAKDRARRLGLKIERRT